MRKLVVVTAAAICLAGSVAARPFQARDLAMLDRVTAPRLSADGRFLAHAVRKTDWDANGGVNALHVIDLRSATAQPLVVTSSEKMAPAARWSDDGRWLFFLSGKSGSAQVWRVGPDGGGLRQVTALPIDVTGFRLMPGGRGILVSADVHADCATLACTRTRIDEQAKVKPTGVRIRKGANRFWDSYEDERRVGLFHVPFDLPGAPAEAPSLLRNFDADIAADDNNVVVSRDGRTVYFTSRDPAVEAGADAFTWLYSVRVDGAGAPKRVAGGPRSSIARPSLSADGRSLAFIQSNGAMWTYGRGAVMVMDLKSGRVRDLTPGLDVNISRIGWAGNGRLLATGDERGQAPLFAIDAKSGAVTRLSAEGQVSDFDAAEGTTAFVRESLTSPQQIFVQQGSEPARQITNAGAEVLAQTSLGEAEQFSFAGWNGETVHGYVVKPHGYVAGRKYPVAFVIHGGPHGNIGNAWSYRWNPQVWAGMGYAVVAVDFHGSSGYGEAFGLSIINHWGDRPLEDLQKGWAHALSRYTYLDGTRACALGGSYGGYMVAWIASQWKAPWKCLVNHAGVFDVRSTGWSMDITAFTDSQFGGAPQMADLERFNPALHARDWKVPMLVIHGARDFRVPLDQGIAAHNAARRGGVPTELLLFPDENHWVLKPQNSVQWYQVVEEWMDRWTGAAQPAPAA